MYSADFSHLFIFCVILSAFTALSFAGSNASADEPDASSFINVEGGGFTMGSELPDHVMRNAHHPDYQDYTGPDWDEYPPHKVELSSFEIARRQVTVAEFLEFRPEHIKVLRDFGADDSPEAPVTMVNWRDAAAYCEWLSARSGETYRLPTEAEWEFAAHRKSGLGLEGMDDLILEWCSDWWSPYREEAVFDPRGPADGIVKVVRGGGGSSREMSVITTEIDGEFEDEEVTGLWRPQDRSGTVPGDRRRRIGFRIVRGELPEGHVREPEPDAGIFRDVSQEPCDWEVDFDMDEPYFEGGWNYTAKIEREDFETLPFWGRKHVPNLTYSDNGDMLISFFTAPRDGVHRLAVLMSRLRKGENEWDKPARFFYAPDCNTESTALHKTGDGEIHFYCSLSEMFAAEGRSHGQDWSVVRRTSRDQGATWSAPQIVLEYPADRATLKDYSGTPRLWPHMDMFYHSDGTLLAPSDAGWPSEHNRPWGSVIWQSTDDGDTWTEMTRFGWNPDVHRSFGWEPDRPDLKDGESGWIVGYHATVVELKNGDLMALGRGMNIDGRAPMSISSDGGRTWRYRASDFEPLGSHQRTRIMRLAEGPLLALWYSDTTGRPRDEMRGIEVKGSSGETHTGYGLYATVSYDEGESWVHPRIIPIDESDPLRGDRSGYITAVQTPDNIIHVANSQRYWRFNLAWLNEPVNISAGK